MRRLSLWMHGHPMVGDTLIACGLLVLDLLVFVSATVSHQPGTKPWYVAVPLDLVVVAPLVFRRRRPLAVAYLVLLLGIPHSLLMVGLSSLVARGIGLYTVLVFVGRRHGVLYLVALLAVMGGEIAVQTEQNPLGAVIPVSLTVALCWVLGEFVAARRAYHAEVEARLHLLETERDQASRIAVAEERGRIARELHDVVAHAVSVIVVQADGASYAIRSNPDLAERAVQTISETGRGALVELRRLLDVLRHDGGEGEPRVPQPGAGELAELAERVRAAGVPVRLVIEDDLDDLPAGVSLGVYRIVQESLTNTLKHAGPGAAALVRVRREGDSVHVEVSDDGAGVAPALVSPPSLQDTGTPGGGNGLIGMRERANVFGGTLRAGPAPGGGWLVHATLPARLSP